MLRYLCCNYCPLFDAVALAEDKTINGKKMTQLDGKVVLITGVSSGIGRAAAQLFALQGAAVFGVDCDLEAGEALATELLQKNLKF